MEAGLVQVPEEVKVCTEARPLAKPEAVPLFVIVPPDATVSVCPDGIVNPVMVEPAKSSVPFTSRVADAGMVNVSEASPRVTSVPERGEILLTLTSLI
jgi:hypothetical protein